MPIALAVVISADVFDVVLSSLPNTAVAIATAAWELLVVFLFLIVDGKLFAAAARREVEWHGRLIVSTRDIIVVSCNIDSGYW